jgi:hypothetical protein
VCEPVHRSPALCQPSEASRLGPLHVAAEGKAGLTPVHVASSAGHIKMLELLVKHGGDVNRKAAKGKTCLNAAIAKGAVRPCLTSALATTAVPEPQQS